MKLTIEDYQKLVSGELSRASVEVSDLFDLASVLAVTGNYEAKQIIYEHYILHHPNASKEDMKRVKIYSADLIRRNGNPDLALRVLRKLDPPLEDVGLAEYLMAVVQCRLMTRDYKKAEAAVRHLIRVADRGQIPSNKQAYYLTAGLDLKFRTKTLDQEFENWFKKYMDLPQDVNGPYASYAKMSYWSLGTIACILRGNYPKAVECASHCFESTDVPREKAFAAVLFLYAAWQADPNDENLTTQAMTKYFKENRQALLPTDIVAIQEEHNWVMAKLKLG